jgi:class 3 adenylate cyclase/tetratricopeptide (TPR) repeat protein
VNCSECRQDNPDDSRFCRACGRALVEVRDHAPRAYTPRHLAERILNSRASLEGERKHVTVLFADVEDFTRLSGSMDPEDVHFLMEEIFAILLETVHRYEGTINQFLGDGVMALFGAPVALEDHALRAVRAALEIQDQMAAHGADLRARFGTAPALRIGLNSGQVVVGRIGDDLRMDYTAQGDIVNLAARLQQIAGAGFVAMGETTRRLVAGSVQCVPLGPHQVKGRLHPVAVFRPVRALDGGEVDLVFRNSGLSPFVGRDKELSVLLESFHAASPGGPRVVKVVGEAGIGKSRLLTELRRRLEGPDLNWFTGHCVPYGRSTPYRPVLKTIRLACGLHDGTSAEAAAEALDVLVAPLGERRSEVAPIVQWLLGHQQSADDGPARSPVDRPLAITRAIDAIVELLAARGPLVLAWEDCDWLDSASAEYLAGLTERLPSGKPILIILTYRSPESSGAARPNGQELVLLPLTADQSAMLVTHLASDRLGPELVTLAVDRAGGNPLFLEELTRTLLESGEPGVPPTVDALLRARIDRLASPLKSVLEIAAVIGQEFSSVLLGQVVAEKVDLTAALAELVRCGVLSESDTSAGVFRFRQPLLQEVAYEGWLHHRRRDVHRAIGTAIEHLYAHRLFEHIEKLARHFTRSEDWSRAVYYQRAAGRKALVLCANREAIRRFTRALQILDRMSDSVGKLVESVDLRLDLCSPHLQLGQLDEVARLCTEAEPIVEKLDDRRRLADVYSHLSNYHYLKGEPDTAIEFGRRCLETGAGKDPAPLAHAPRQYLGMCHHVLGRYRQASTILTEHIEALETGQDVRRFGPVNLSYVSSCGWLAFTLAELGEFPDAHESAAQALRAATMAGSAYAETIASAFSGLVMQAQGDLDRAIPLLDQSFKSSVEHQLVVWRPIAGTLLGHALAMQGRGPLGLELLNEAAALAESVGVLVYRALWTARLAEAWMLAGDVSKALETARHAVELAERHKERGSHAHALAVLGTLYARPSTGSLPQAREHLGRGLLEAEELGMRPLMCRCYDVLGDVAHRQDDAATARQLKESSRTMQRELGLVAWWRRLLDPTPAAASGNKSELRRHPRVRVSWPVLVDTGPQRLRLQTMDVSALAAKVLSDHAFEVGTSAMLRFERPGCDPVEMQGRVARTDTDGFVFAFDSAFTLNLPVPEDEKMS